MYWIFHERDGEWELFIFLDHNANRIQIILQKSKSIKLKSKSLSPCIYKIVWQMNFLLYIELLILHFIKIKYWTKQKTYCMKPDQVHVYDTGIYHTCIYVTVW